MNGVLRFAYRFTFFTYMFSLREQGKAKKAKDYQDVGQQLMLRISRTDPLTQAKLQEISDQLHSALILYMCATSLVFLGGFFIYAVLRAFRVVGEHKDEVVSRVLEQEAYRAEIRQPRFAAV